MSHKNQLVKKVDLIFLMNHRNFWISVLLKFANGKLRLSYVQFCIRYYDYKRIRERDHYFWEEYNYAKGPLLLISLGLTCLGHVTLGVVFSLSLLVWTFFTSFFIKTEAAAMKGTDTFSDKTCTSVSPSACQIDIGPSEHFDFTWKQSLN